MADDTIKKLQKYLGDDDYKQFLTFCLEPRQWSEISKLSIKTSKVFQMIKDLTTIEALKYASGKYETASYVQEHIE